MRACIICLLLFISAGCGTLEPSRPSANFALSNEDRKFAKALAHYSQGLIYERDLGKTSAAAMDAFTLAARLDPNTHKLHAKAAMVAIERHLTEPAIALLEESCKANPKSSQARLDLAALYQAAGRSEDAIAQYRRVLELDPECAFAYLSLAQLYFESKHDKDAIQTIRTAAQHPLVAPPATHFCLMKGREFIVAGQIERSIPCFRLIAELSPERRGEFYVLIGSLYEEMGFVKEARRDFVQALKERPLLAEAFVRLALLDLQTNPRKAIEMLLQGDKALPDNSAILFLLAYIYSHENMHVSAMEVFDRIEKSIDKEYAAKLPADYFFYYGAACERAGQLDKAVSIFEKCLERYPSAHNVLNYLAYMWAEKGVQLDKAETYVKRALELHPENGAYIDTLGWIYYQQHKYPDALKCILKADELVRDDAVVKDHLGDIYERLGEEDQALRNWKESFLLDPHSKAVREKLTLRKVDVDALAKEDAKASPVRQSDQ